MPSDKPMKIIVELIQGDVTNITFREFHPIPAGKMQRMFIILQRFYKQEIRKLRIEERKRQFKLAQEAEMKESKDGRPEERITEGTAE